MYTAQNFSSLHGTPGFSETLLNNHFTLYEGYVKNTNTLIETLRSGKRAAGTPEYNELTRRFGWEWNGMRLHELYFANLKNGGQTTTAGGPLEALLTATWGSFENWKKDFMAVGGMRGIGWAILSYDAEQKALFNVWVNEHDVGNLAGAKPLLIMDVFEHAFMIDYGIKRADYIQSFMGAVDWSVVEKRLV